MSPPPTSPTLPCSPCNYVQSPRHPTPPSPRPLSPLPFPLSPSFPILLLFPTSTFPPPHPLTPLVAAVVWRAADACAICREGRERPQGNQRMDLSELLPPPTLPHAPHVLPSAPASPLAPRSSVDRGAPPPQAPPLRPLLTSDARCGRLDANLASSHGRAARELKASRRRPAG